MQRFALQTASSYGLSSLLTNASLDYTTYVSPYAHPAIVPQRVVSTWVTETGAQAVGGTQPAATGMATITQNGGSTWAANGLYGTSTKQGDYLSFSTTAFQVTIVLTGQVSAAPTRAASGATIGQVGPVAGSGFTANSIRNGGIATISIDGVVVTTLDTYNAAPSYTLYLDGLSHTIVITYSGHNPALNSVTAPDQIMLAVESISYGTGTGAGPATYTTPIYDLVDSATQAVVAEWVQSTPLVSVSAATGATPTPDVTWTTHTIAAAALGLSTTADGTQYGTAGLMSLGRGRYLQLTFTLAGASGVPPWMRDIGIYTWVPERDPILARLHLGQGVIAGPLLAAFVATLATHALDRRQDALDLYAAGSLGGATDTYLAGYLTDLALQQVTGEQPETARARGRAVLSAAGLTLTAIAQEVAILVTGSVGPVSITGAPGALVVSCKNVVVSQGTGSAYTVSVPAGPYLGMPGLQPGAYTIPTSAQGIIYTHITTTLQPVASTVTVTFN